MKHDFNERRENRINYARAQAAKNEKEAGQLYSSASDMASVIPMAQPILVGHHSEKRDRRYRQKIHDKMGSSVEKQKKAAIMPKRPKRSPQMMRFFPMIPRP
nr:DUF3560 domain-containing protein [Pedobacter miscanthi]